MTTIGGQNVDITNGRTPVPSFSFHREDALLASAAGLLEAQPKARAIYLAEEVRFLDC